MSTGSAPNRNLPSSSSSGWRNMPPYRSTFGDAHDAISSTNTTTTKDATGSAATATTYYRASCYCGRVQYEVRHDPLNAKLCHCRGCQKLHGAPFEWVAVFDKTNVRFPNPSSLDYLYFYSSELDQGWDAAARTNVDAETDDANVRPSLSALSLPVKVSCSHCRTPIADEGRHMWLAFCTLFGFTVEDDDGGGGGGGGGIPSAFQHSCHLFYNQRCIDLHDGDDYRDKWQGHRNKSPRWIMPKK